MRALYLTHPQVRLDAAVPVPLWGLSQEGRARAQAFADRGAVPEGAYIFSSRETKALELAEILAGAAGTPVLPDHLMGENDRSATGFLPPALFEDAAERFFARPHDSIEGWERAIDAQERIVEAVANALESVPAGTPVILCGHGAVGTLLKCHIMNRPIARSEDQRRMADPGGGNCFVFDLARGLAETDWLAMEAIAADWFDRAVLPAGSK